MRHTLSMVLLYAILAEIVFGAAVWFHYTTSNYRYAPLVVGGVCISVWFSAHFDNASDRG